MQYESRPAAPVVTIFAVINFVLAGLSGLWLLFILAILVYGVGFSGDQGGELAAGVLGSILLATPGFLGAAVYLVAALGLMRRQAWGYYFHCAGAALAALTCIGLAYTLFALIFATRPEFTAVFFPATDQRSG